MNAFIKVLFCPMRTFRETKVAINFPTMSFIVILVFMLFNLILMIPITEKVNSFTFSMMKIAEEQKDMLMQVTHKMRYLQVVGSEIFYIAMFIFYALLLCLFVRVINIKLKFKKSMQLVVYSYFIVVIGDIVNTVILYMRGIEAIKNPYDISMLGINLFTSVDQVGATIYSLLAYFNPFQLLFIVLLTIGIKTYTGKAAYKCLFIAVFFWSITILIPTLTVYYSQLSIVNS